MPSNGIMHAMRALNQQEDDLTKALDLSLRKVKSKRQALSKAKEAHARREVVFKDNVKKIKKRAGELNELLGCSKLMERDDPEKHRKLLKPVALQEMGMEEDDGEVEERRVVVRKKAVPKASRGTSQARFAEQSKLHIQGQTTRLFDKADAAKRARTRGNNVVVPDEEVSSDTPQEEREKRRPVIRQPTGSETEVALVNTVDAGSDYEADGSDDPMHSTVDGDDVKDSGSRRSGDASAGGLFNFAAVQARMQSTLRPVSGERDRSDARSGARAQNPTPQDYQVWHVLGDSLERETGGRDVGAFGNTSDGYADAKRYPEVSYRRGGFDDDAGSIASDSSDGLFVSEQRAPIPSSRGSTPEYMLRASPEPKATRRAGRGGGAHVKGLATSQNRVASRNRFAKAPTPQQHQNTASAPPTNTQHQQSAIMASRGDNRSPIPPDSGDRPSGESFKPADIPVLSIEGADKDSIKSADEDEDHFDVNVDHPAPIGLFSFDRYLAAEQGDGQAAPRPGYAGTTRQERKYRVSYARAEDEEENDVLNPPTGELPTSTFSSTGKQSNNGSRLPSRANSMASDADMVASRGLSTPGFSDGTGGSPGAEEYENGEGEANSEATEDLSSDYESTSKATPKKQATGTKKGARRVPRRAPGTRCCECFRLHRKCTHTDPATGAGDEVDEENADPKFRAMRARKRAAQQMGSFMPPSKRTYYNTYGPDPEPVKTNFGQQNRSGGVARGLTFDISSAIAGKVLGDAKKRKESEEATPDRERTPGKKDENEGDEEVEERGEDNGDEE